MSAPFSIIIPTLNAAEALPSTLNALLPGIGAGLIRELIISDGGSMDATCALAKDVGAEIVTGPAGRGGQLRRGAEISKADWLLFLHADTHLDPDWVGALAVHIAQHPEKAAVFKLAFRASGGRALWVAGWANLRTKLFDLPYGDQGLLISRAHYEQIGGYPDQPLMEDVAIARALKGRLHLLDCTARTSPDRYMAEGWFRRGSRNLWTLARYLLGADPETLARHYQKR